MRDTVLIVTHIGNIIAYSFTLYYACNHLHIPMLAHAFKEFDPGQLKYLTVWDVERPLQLGRMAKESLLVGFHAISCLQFAFAVHYDYTYVVIPSTLARTNSDIGGKFKFLTFWNAILQAVFFMICLLNDIFGTNAVNPKKVPLIRKVKDFVHASLAFPVAMFVGVTFWSIMFVDRELVLPKAVDPYFPTWLNHLMHTLIMVSTVFEMITAPRAYPKRSHGFGGLLAFMLTYLVWMHLIYFKSGVWVYPVMEVLSVPLKIVFIVVLLGLTSILYVVGETMDCALWRKPWGQPAKCHSKSK